MSVPKMVTLRDAIAGVQGLSEHDGHGIDFLTGRAARDPHANGLTLILGGEQGQDRRGLEGVEGLGVAKELGDADEELTEQRLDLTAIGLEPLDVVRGALNMQHLHAALQPPDQGRVLVAAEIVRAAGVQEGRDLGQVLLEVAALAVAILLLRNPDQMRGIVDELPRHGLDRHDVIDQAGGRRAARHALQGRGIELGLRQRQAAVLLDGADADRAVAPDTREHDADGALATVLGQRGEEGIDRPAKLARRRRRGDLENAILDGERRIRRNDEDTVLFDCGAIRGRDDRNGALRPEQLDQEALVVRVEMLHQHEGHAGVGRRLRQKALEGGEPTCGGADADDEGWVRSV